jgi:hypothetical protein
MMASVLLGVLLTGVAGQEEDWGFGGSPEPEPEPAGYRKDCQPSMMEAEAIRLQDEAAGGARGARADPRLCFFLCFFPLVLFARGLICVYPEGCLS